MNKMYLFSEIYILQLYNKSSLYNMIKTLDVETFILCVKNNMKY